MKRRLRKVLWASIALGWGLVVLAALGALLVAIDSVIGGRYAGAALAAVGGGAMVGAAIGIERRLDGPLGGRKGFDRTAARSVRIACAAMLAVCLVVAAHVVKVIAETGVDGWLNSKATSFGELLVVMAMLLALLFLLAWPVALGLAKLMNWINDKRVERMVRQVRKARQARDRLDSS